MHTLEVHVAIPDDGKVPTIDSDSSYNITTINKESTKVMANSVFGAMYAMETFSQLVNSTGHFECSSVQLHDSPA